MNALEYTDQELEKQLNLLEIHLKQTSYEKDFCNECIRKHVLVIEGLAEEGIGFSSEPEKYANVAQLTREIRNSDISNSLELSKRVREIRKSLGCNPCKQIEAVAKDLNNPKTYFNYLNKTEKQNMVEYMELAVMNAGQFAAEGVRYFSEKYPTDEPGKWDKYLTIGGGIALQALGVFVPRLPSVVKTLSLVAGSNLLAGGVVKMVKGAGTTATVRAVAAPINAGYAPTFGGPTFRGAITASHIPTRYARAGILAGAQAFEAPEHADLIRVD